MRDTPLRKESRETYSSISPERDPPEFSGEREIVRNNFAAEGE